MGHYSSDPEWVDIVPIPQDEGGPDPLAAIAYEEDYSEAMSYLRAVMAKNEFSERVLALTEDVIDMNAAHYTVWLYRAKTLSELKKDLREEIKWLNDTALRHQKNYQIWLSSPHHRQLIMDILGDPTGEAAFISRMFEKDAKNYHVWSYRQWLVRRFDLWEDELPDIEVLLKKDVRNNSAWNHRWFVVFGRGTTVGKDVVDREIEYAKRSISEAPQNQSPWNYLRGVLRKANRPPSDLGCFAEEFAPLDKPDEVRSSHALDFLADMYGENGKEKDKASAALDLLAYRYDPIRANYWNYRKSLLAEASGTA